jgi:hypothetical protein
MYTNSIWDTFKGVYNSFHLRWRCKDLTKLVTLSKLFRHIKMRVLTTLCLKWICSLLWCEKNLWTYIFVEQERTISFGRSFPECRSGIRKPVSPVRFDRRGWDDDEADHRCVGAAGLQDQEVQRDHPVLPELRRVVGGEPRRGAVHLPLRLPRTGIHSDYIPTCPFLFTQTTIFSSYDKIRIDPG